mmetsp:Transcript_34281/g.88577  ORF Transcript_34281/g.88577 Transcript_34281/m.88577 type:complete len:329 (-) Transcript_34281:2832-3818(-)
MKLEMLLIVISIRRPLQGRDLAQAEGKGLVRNIRCKPVQPSRLSLPCLQARIECLFVVKEVGRVEALDSRCTPGLDNAKFSPVVHFEFCTHHLDCVSCRQGGLDVDGCPRPIRYVHSGSLRAEQLGSSVEELNLVVESFYPAVDIFRIGRSEYVLISARCELDFLSHFDVVEPPFAFKCTNIHRASLFAIQIEQCIIWSLSYLINGVVVQIDRCPAHLHRHVEVVAERTIRSKYEVPLFPSCSSFPLHQPPLLQYFHIVVCKLPFLSLLFLCLVQFPLVNDLRLLYCIAKSGDPRGATAVYTAELVTCPREKPSLHFIEAECPLDVTF